MSTRSLGQLTLDLVARIGGFTDPLDKAERHSRQRMQQIQRNAKESAAAFVRMGTATAAAGAGMLAFTSHAATSARELANQAQLANTSTQELQKWGYASTSVGIEQDKLADILKDVNDRVGDFIATGGGPMADFFDNIAPKVGVTADQFRKLSGPQALQLYFDSLQKANLNQQDMTFYLEAMASDTTALIPLLRDGGRAFAEIGQEAEDLGIVLSDTQTDALVDFANDVDQLKNVMSAGAQVAAAELAPAMSELADKGLAVAEAFQRGEYDDQIQLLADLATTATVAAGAYGTYRAAVMAATIAQGAFYAATVSNPIGALVVVLGTAVGALFTYREELGLTASAAERTANRVDELTNAIDLNNEAAIKGQLVNLTGQMLELEQQAQEARRSLDELAETSTDPGPFRNSTVLGVDAAERRQYYESLREAEEGLAANEEAAQKLRDQLNVLAQTGIDPVERSFQSMGTSASSATSDAEKQAETIRDQIAALKLQAETVGFSADQQTLHKLATEGATSAQLAQARAALETVAAYEEQQEKLDTYQRLVAEMRTPEEQLNDTLRERLEILDAVNVSERERADMLERIADASDVDLGGDNDAWSGWLESAENAFTDFDNLNRQVAESFTSRFGDAIEGVIFDYENLGDAAQGVADGMARSVVNALGQMAAQWLAYQAVQLVVGKTTQSTAAASMVATAQAQSAMAGLNAFTSTAAIPVIGPAAAPAAAATAVAATQPMAAAVSSFALAGMAHDGIDSVPETGTWLLQQGERVTTSDTSAKLDRTLDDVQSRMVEPGESAAGGPAGGLNVTVDARGATDPAAVRRQVQQGIEETIARVGKDFATNGRLRRLLRV
ncbi:phage tail tape measure C-terminal domain-containing protein [Salinicola aestuarinus]|uniref:phage tail tape measure C-terminal domain-containing protein n=1 Tax=Salinicola aestuarinus TaxID=1949082 RepID=UPI00130097E7|nr:phage tail tape measure C-terminal domain-containing protein [Salinicola aestuarinus]